MKQRSPSFNISRTNLLILIALILGAIAILYPLLVVLQASLTTTDGHFTLANFQQAWQQGRFLLAFANSTIVALSVTALQIVTSALAGYALARLEFKGKQAILLLILATLVIPFQLLVIPIFVVLKWAHLIDSYWSLILPTAANGFGIFLMRQYFGSIPVELEEAAALDGANRLQ
ncbi:MAG: carbohydrate ABC transporter permease, partial [Cyanobacteria bacterium J06555_3]